MTEAYRRGFLTKCAERGLDGLRLLEKRAQYDPYGISTGSYGMDPTDNWQSFNPTPTSPSTFTSPSLSHPVDPVKSDEAVRNMDSKAIGDLYARGPAIMLASIPGAGLGLAGASGLIGAGETAGSLLEGKGLNEATENGAKAGLLTYGGGKALEGIGRHVVAPAYRWVAPRAHRLYDNLVKTVPRVSREWVGSDVHKAALQAARRAEPNPVSKLWRRVTFRDPMRPSVDAAADAYSDDIYRAFREQALGEPSLEDAARRIAYDIDTYNGKLSPQGTRLLRAVRSNPDLFIKDNNAATRLVSSNLRGTALDGRQADAALRTMLSPFSAYRSDVNKLMEQGLDYNTALRKVIRDRVHRSANAYTAKTFIDGVERRARGVPLPKKGYTHDELMRELGRDGDFIFKGGNRHALSPAEFDNPLFYSHNPYVSEGYAGGGGIGTPAHPSDPSTFWAVPIGEKGAISAEAANSRFTPHISAVDKDAIAEAAREARGAELSGKKVSRSSGIGEWGDDTHYEIVLRGLENQKARELGRRFLTLPGKTLIDDGMVARGPVGGFGDTTRFLRIPNGAEGDELLGQLATPSYDRVRDYLTKAKDSAELERLVEIFPRLR